ncbi:hypothetical protein BKA62DRAFT_295072 [Auriculariales sp. MPI-PUGE-AT-0066]|nr:hypothetical protein BKA62DRAFT_295072 [Auriculariales sp. MPI-PUGE-AT-0066]
MSAPLETDVSRRSGLARATLAHGPRAQQQQQALLDKPSDEYLDAVEAEWNKRLDAEVEVLVDGMNDLVAIAAIGDKDKFHIAQEAFQAQCRAEAMVRSANSLFSMTHALKLMLLIGDESQLVRQRNDELTRVRGEVHADKKRSAEIIDELLHDDIMVLHGEDELAAQLETQTTLVGSGTGSVAETMVNT